MPVIGKFFAAIQARHVSSRDGRSSREALTWPLCNRKAEVLVAATKQHVEQTRHKSPPPNFGSPGSVNLPTLAIIVLQYMIQCTKMFMCRRTVTLDSEKLKKVRRL